MKKIQKILLNAGYALFLFDTQTVNFETSRPFESTHNESLFIYNLLTMNKIYPPFIELVFSRSFGHTENTLLPYR